MVLGLSKIELAIAILLLIYILGNFKTSLKLMFLFKTPWPPIIMFALLVYLFVYNHGIIFLLYVFALYEYMRRSDKDLFDDYMFYFEDVIQDELIKENFEDDEDEVPDSEMSGIDDPDDLYPMPQDIKEGREEFRKEAFQNNDAVPLILDPDDPPDHLKSPDMQSLVRQPITNIVEDAKVIEEFTALLGKDSLEKSIIDKKSPIGHSSSIKYKSTAYKPLGSNLTGASLI